MKNSNSTNAQHNEHSEQYSTGDRVRVMDHRNRTYHGVVLRVLDGGDRLEIRREHSPKVTIVSVR